MSVYATFIAKIQSCVHASDLIKLSLGNYIGPEQDLKNIYVKPVIIKRVLKLSFTYRYKTRDIVKNYELQPAFDLIAEYLQDTQFRVATLFTEAENITCQYNNKGLWFVKTEKATAKKELSLQHDHQKARKLTPKNKEYLVDLRLTDTLGNVYNNAQDKWRQINHYIDLLSPDLKDLANTASLNVVDMGAGKGYLTFALYDYLTSTLANATTVVGVEYRQDLVDLCNGFAQKAQFTGLSFVRGSIEDYQHAQQMHVLIALHACDTATDDAIYQGITNQASLIVVAPCCHKQVRRELERVKAVNALEFMTQHGIFMERHAEMLTDSIRALILEYFGYQTKVQQFISDAHTPKNVLITAVKKSVNPQRQLEILHELKSLKAYFGIDYHHLERITGLEQKDA